MLGRTQSGRRTASAHSQDPGAPGMIRGGSMGKMEKQANILGWLGVALAVTGLVVGKALRDSGAGNALIGIVILAPAITGSLIFIFDAKVVRAVFPTPFKKAF